MNKTIHITLTSPSNLCQEIKDGIALKTAIIEQIIAQLRVAVLDAQRNSDCEAKIEIKGSNPT